MFRPNAVTYRLRYIKRKNTSVIRKLFSLFLLFALMAGILSIIEKRLESPLVQISESRVKYIINEAINEAVEKRLPAYKDNLVLINTDSAQRIKSIQSNMALINKLTAEISSDVQERLANLEDVTIHIPIGTLFGYSVLSGTGPDLKVKIKPYGSVFANVRSELTDAGINQTKHSVILDLKIETGIITPFKQKKLDVLISVPVSETVIIGDTPQVYTDKKK